MMRPRTAARSDDRSVSFVVNYVLVIAITAVLITGIIIAGGSFVEDQREQVIAGEMRIIGNHVAGNLEQVDRYVRAGLGPPSDAYINQSFGTDVTGSTWSVELDERGDTSQVVVNSTRPEVSVRVNTTVQTDIDEDSYSETGKISVAYDPSSNELVIRDA
jgi:FlaG/FlaF family flagellin (archaellin)